MSTRMTAKEAKEAAQSARESVAQALKKQAEIDYFTVVQPAIQKAVKDGFTSCRMGAVADRCMALLKEDGFEIDRKKSSCDSCFESWGMCNECANVDGWEIKWQ